MLESEDAHEGLPPATRCYRPKPHASRRCSFMPIRFSSHIFQAQVVTRKLGDLTDRKSARAQERLRGERVRVAAKPSVEGVERRTK